MHTHIYINTHVHIMYIPCIERRSNSDARNAIPSQSCSFERTCLTTSARESLRETLRSSERFYFALMRA